MNRREGIAIFILIFLGVLTRMLFFSYPPSAVFDEVYMGNFALDYASGAYYFDLHPPLGKLLITLFGSLFGLLVPVDFSSIGDALPPAFVTLRVLPMLFGALLPAVIFLLARLLRISFSASILAGLLVVFENSLVVQSHFILFDEMLLLFGFLSLVSYLLSVRYREVNRNRLFWLYFCLSALFAASSASIKWTGLSFAGLIALLELARVYKEGWSRKTLMRIVVFVGIFLATYFSFFAVHLRLLPRSGTGDAFMSPEFRKDLTGSEYEGRSDLRSISLLEKVAELNVAMLRANETIGTHEYSSRWYTWPLMKRPIYYWVGGENQKIYFLGNPMVYWSGALALLFLLGWITRSFIVKDGQDRRRTALFIVGGYALNFLPFMFIGRVMFLYHYLPALLFGILAFVFVVDSVGKRARKWGIPLFLLVIFLIFLYFAPLTYGIKPILGDLESRFWFDSWR